MEKGCSEKHPLGLPQEYAADIYPKVRLEAGALHLTKYLIRFRGLFLTAKVMHFLETARVMWINRPKYVQYCITAKK